jgi:quinol-cytochrome oxidoreductase complex cytochrome b subunit
LSGGAAQTSTFLPRKREAMKLVEEKAIWKAGVEPDAPQGGKLDGKPPLDGAGRALAWAVLGVFVAECLTGLVLSLYFRSGAESHFDAKRYLEFDVPFGMAMRRLHMLFALALLFVAPFAVARAVLYKRQPGGRAAYTAALVALVALWLALPVPRSFTPWETVSAQVADWLPANQAAPLKGINARYSARDLLPDPEEIRSARRRHVYLNHVMAAPLALISLLAVGAHKLRKRR